MHGWVMGWVGVGEIDVGWPLLLRVLRPYGGPTRAWHGMAGRPRSKGTL
jgi:hypothetical protein